MTLCARCLVFPALARASREEIIEYKASQLHLALALVGGGIETQISRSDQRLRKIRPDLGSQDAGAFGGFKGT